MKFVQANGLTLHLNIEGDAGGVPLVFINSLGCDMRIWDSVVPHFVEDFHIIRYDKRGHGLSDCPPAPYTIRDHTDDLLGILDYLQIQEVILVGISVGGLIAMDFASIQPQRVPALILCDTAPKLGAAEMWSDRINAVHENGMVAVGDSILARWFAPTFKEQYPTAYRGYFNMLTRMPVEGYVGTCEAIRDADLTEHVAAIQAPALVVCGTEDAATLPEVVRGLVDMLPDASFECIDNAGHLPCVEQPDRLAQVMQRFLKDNDYGG